MKVLDWAKTSGIILKLPASVVSYIIKISTAVNDLVKRSHDTAWIPSHLEPVGLYCSNGKRPDGASVVPWKGGKVLMWDAT